MAFDPTANSPQLGSWGLSPLGAPLGAPSASTMPRAQRGIQLTPELIAQMRQQALQLQQPPTEPIRHWTQGLAELVRAIQGNREADFARQQELQGRQQGAEAIGQIYAPYLSQGGGKPSPSAASGAAPAAMSTDGTAGAMTTTASDNGPDSLSPNLLQKVQGYEGFKPNAYWDEKQYSIGYGTRANSPNETIDRDEASRRMQAELGNAQGQVDRILPANAPSNVRDALTSFTYNVGGGWTNGSLLASAIQSGDYNKAAQLMQAYNRSSGAVNPGLVQRRADEGRWMAGSQTGGRGLFAPIQPSVSRETGPAGADNQASAEPATPTRLAYASDTSDLPPEITRGTSPAPSRATPPSAFDTGVPPVSNLSPFVNAIAGRPVPPVSAAATPPISAPLPGNVPDFAKQAAALAADRGQSVPLSPEQGAAVLRPAVQPSTVASVPTPPAPAAPPAVPTVDTSAVPVPLPRVRPVVPLAPGAAIPGAVGPTSVGGAPLVPPRAAAPPLGTAPANAALLSAIAGPAGAAGAQNQSAPIRVAQAGMPIVAAPTGNVVPPAAAGAPSAAPGAPTGLPTPLTSATGQVTQDQLTRVLANPWVPEQAKAAMLQMIQQRGQPQIMDVEGGKLMYNAAGQKVFIPEPKFGKAEISGVGTVDTVSHFNPGTGQWETRLLTPGGGGAGTTQPTGGGGALTDGMARPNAQALGEPDLSSIGAMQRAAVAQAGAKKTAEEAGSTRAKTLSGIKFGITGDAFNAARQSPLIDLATRIAPLAYTGAGEGAALTLNRIADQLGITEKKAAPRELFNQVSSKLLADQFANIRNMSKEEGSEGGKIFKSLLDIEEKANITPEDSLPGVLAKLAFMKKAGESLQRWGDLADDYSAAHNGQIDEGFLKQLRKDMASQNFDDILSSADATSPTGRSEQKLPKAGDIEGGYRFKGGNPADKNNWEIVPTTAPVSR